MAVWRSWPRIVVEFVKSGFYSTSGHQLTEEERDELLATTAYFFVQRARKAMAFKNQSKWVMGKRLGNKEDRTELVWRALPHARLLRARSETLTSALLRVRFSCVWVFSFCWVAFLRIFVWILSVKRVSLWVFSFSRDETRLFSKSFP